MDDLISREAAIEAIGERPLSWNDTPEELQAIIDWDCDIAAIKSVPTVDAVPVVHGRWIDETPEDYLDPRMRCSICKEIETPLIKWRYCPNCGAKMDA